MNAVLDTNVLVSALLTPDGTCGEILWLVFEEIVQPYLDMRVLREYEGVLPRPALGLDPGDVEGTLNVMRTRSDFVEPTPLAVTLPDPTDVPFLEVAAECGAVLVTGNLRHFPKDRRAGVTVLSPREFLDLLGRSA